MARLVLLCTVLATLLVPGLAPAETGKGEPLVYVPLDHVTAGKPFPLIGSDLGSNATVRFRISRDQLDVRLGTTKAGPNGKFRTTLTLPGDFPDGYAFLTARGSGTKGASTWILVGERAESQPTASGGGGTDWSRNAALILVALVVVVVGAGLALVVVRAPRR